MVDGFTLLLEWEEFEAVLVDQFVHAVLGRAEPLAAQVDLKGWFDVLGVGPTGHAIAGFDDDGIDPVITESESRGQAAEA
ncbi:hypothetical protein GCM10011401_03210 [Nesterenkonia cremea]|uniref:Uncharacterized protein n=1 Tax=Nesterenkonia cremea TaxID=1882340 RepID=A0A917AL04_9MICC|nr:hypothetical protein GCM10011401_03210 [Nesterenkonia cremea]